MDWSDHALWWPARNHWLTRTRSTLDQCGVAADALLHFTPMHKILRVQLPDMRCLDCRVDFSVKTFNAVINLCKELGNLKMSMILLFKEQLCVHNLLIKHFIPTHKRSIFCIFNFYTRYHTRKCSHNKCHVSKIESV